MTLSSFELHLARRYLKSTRKEAFTSFLSAVAAGGIGLGVAALVVALAALEGMQHALRSQILARTPSLAVTLPPGADVADVVAFERAVSDAGGVDVLAVQRVVEGRGWIVAGRRALSVRLMGYQGAPPRSLPGAGERPGLYLPDRMAAQAGLAIGDAVTLASPRPGLTPFGPQPRFLSARLEGVYQEGRGDDEPIAALPLERAEILFGRARAGSLYVTTSSLESALVLADALRTKLPAGTAVETWRELNAPLFLALTLERTGLFAAVSLIVAVAAIALFSDLQLVAAAKKRELALLSAMGAGEPALRRAFVLLGLLLGGGGALAGGLVGGVAAWALDRWQLVRLPAGLLLFDALPLRLRALDVAAVVAITLLLTLGCAALGAWRAARLAPAEVLRG